MSSFVTGRVVALLWCITFILAYRGPGTTLIRALEGVDRPYLPKAVAILAILALIVAIAATWVWALRSRGPSTADAPPAGGLARRRFLIGAATTLGGVAGASAATVARAWGWITVTGPSIGPAVPTSDPSPRDTWQGSRIRAYRQLGRTGAQVSDISLGSGRIKGEKGEQVAREAIARGVTYFDTAPDYAEEGSEIALGRAMKGHRERMFVATKFCTPHGHLGPGASVEEYMEAVEGSLRRLQTDRVDLVHIHACDSIDRLNDPSAHEAFDRLKEQGKVRFLGVSTHTPNLEQVANEAIDSGRFDVMMLAYHHGAWPKLGSIVERADREGVGVVAMKTLKGAKHRGLLELRPEADSYTQAAFKWVLANPHVGCLVISFYEFQHLDEYLHASGQRLTEEDLAVLEKYDRLIAGSHCFPHCGACLDRCPERLPIDDVLRYRMYFEDYGQEKEALRLYGKVERGAERCIGCSAPCAGACPHGVPIAERMIETHRLLTLG